MVRRHYPFTSKKLGRHEIELKHEVSTKTIMRLDCILSPFGHLCQLGTAKVWSPCSLHSPHQYIPQFTTVRELDRRKIEQYYRFPHRLYAFGDKRRNGSWNFDPGRTGKAKFKSRSPYVDDDNDDGYDEKKPWWTFPDEEDYYDEREDDDDYEEASELSWTSIGVQKAVRSLTWIFPAVLIPFLLGNPMGLVMALVLPFAQTAIGTLFQQAWKAILNSVAPAPAKPKRRRKTASYRNRTRSDTAYSNPREAMSSEQYAPYNADEAQLDASGKTPPEASQKFSWADPEEPRKDGLADGLNLGGWEDLDNGIQSPARTVKHKKMGKLSRRVRKREVPLLFRLLIALFPFLSVWGKYL